MVARKRANLVKTALCLMVSAVLVVLAPPHVRESHFIDCRSGRILEEFRLFGIPVSIDVHDTKFSRAVELELSPENPTEWMIFFSRSPFWQPVSPHYELHAIPRELDQFVVKLESRGATDEEIRVQSRQALKYLEQHDVTNLSIYLESL